MQSHGLGRVFIASFNIKFFFVCRPLPLSPTSILFLPQALTFPRPQNNLSAHPDHHRASMNPFRPVLHFGVGVVRIPRAEFWFGLLVLILFLIVVKGFVDLVCEVFELY